MMVRRHGISKRSLALLLLGAVGLYGIVPQLRVFRASFGYLADADVVMACLATLAVVATIVFAALNYWLLALSRVPFRVLALAQAAGLFTNRLVPAGAGSIGINYKMLRKFKHTQARAAVVVAVNNVLGTVTSALLLVSVSVFSVDLHIRLTPKSFLTSVIVALGLIVALLLINHRVRTLLSRMRQALALYGAKKSKLLFAFMSAVALTLSNIGAFWLALHAVTIDISIITAAAVITVATFAGAITPTPGGIGGAEAATVGLLVAAGVVPGKALAGVLLYRLVSLWLPALGGFWAFVYLQRKYKLL